METPEAVALIRDAIPRDAGTWTDLGAGAGTFTRALAECLEPGSRIYAVDRDKRALEAITRWANASAVTTDFDLPGLATDLLDGMLLANALHFVPNADQVLARLTRRLRPGGRVVLIEYDRRRANRWVPFPISREQLPALAASAGLSDPVVTATTPSAFGGDLYVAFADKPRPSAANLS